MPRPSAAASASTRSLQPSVSPTELSRARRRGSEQKRLANRFGLARAAQGPTTSVECEPCATRVRLHTGASAALTS